MASIPTPPQPGLAPLTLSPLQPSTAHLLSLGFACCYVGSLYISNRARLKFETNLPARREVQERAKLAHERWRDDPDVVAARLKMASLASVVCVLGVGAVVYVQNGSDSKRRTAIDQICLVLFSKSCTSASVQDTFADILHSIWSMVQAGWYTLRPHVVLPLLFLGPLLATYLEGTLPFQRRWSWRYTKWRFCSLTGLRTFILGPITEEIVFRACVLAVSNMAHLSKKSMVLWTPLVFGVAIVVAYLVGIVGFYYALPVWSTYPNGSGGVWDRYSH
ncbi:hypothetical protein BKA70DRAFT_1098932 [Coprinopsis sp. MPI-PUGE-AT-0042]|nr:hypothetical protein BKA70DRAFT_1098932 [Coprinopsis sp. MPI-PUGE-AT-0042]